MIEAHFIVGGEEREVRQVEPTWLDRAVANHENVLLGDGNNYIVKAARRNAQRVEVELVPPEFSRGT